MAGGRPRVADSEPGGSEQNRRSKRGRYFSLLTPGLQMLPEPWPGKETDSGSLPAHRAGVREGRRPWGVRDVASNLEQR